MRVLFLMLDSDAGAWSSLYNNGAEKTWLNNLRADDKYLRYKGCKQSLLAKNLVSSKLGNNRFNETFWPIFEAKDFLLRKNIKAELENNILTIGITDRWSSISVKTLLALDYILKHFDFDYVVRGNASVFFNVEKLRDYLDIAKPKYAGPLEKNKPFVTGWSIILSRDTAIQLTDLFSFRHLRYFDDEAIVKVLYEVEKPSRMPYLVVNQLEELKCMNRKVLESYPAIRTKITEKRRRIDDVAQKLIFETIRKS